MSKVDINVHFISAFAVEHRSRQCACFHIMSVWAVCTNGIKNIYGCYVIDIK